MTKRIKLRTLLMGGVLALFFLGLIFRLYWVQVATASEWAAQARKTWMTHKTLTQDRGQITDRNGKVLASDAIAYTVAVGPQRIHDLEEKFPGFQITDQIVAELHTVLGTSEAELRKRIAATKEDGSLRDQSEIRPAGWKVDKAVRDRIDEFAVKLREKTKTKDVGIYFIEESKRYYPNGALASHILGYENKEGKAILGLESKLDNLLKGTAGFIQYEKDRSGTPLPNGEVEVEQPVNGKDVALTLDRDIQFYIEEALREAYAKYNPVSITAIAADPKTMEILGMASLPDFNPNSYGSTKNQAAFKDNGIQSVYEPGSTFKIVTLAAAVQEGLFDPEASYKSGTIRVDKKSRPIKDYNGYGWGDITYLDGLKHSSNVAFVKLGYEKLGTDKFIGYINSFGFGTKTGIELPGELGGSINIDKSIPRDVATATFGQGSVLVTPIQQVAAVAAVANGGNLLKPHIIKSITDPTSGEKQVFEPEKIRQVISAETSKKVAGYLETVVSDQKIGTGKNAYIPGYRIAGKTGTAQKVINGKYAEDKYVVSFIGFAPVEDPQIVLLVIVDQPDIPAAGGGSVAAPIFKQIMGQSLHRLGISPQLPKADAAKEAKTASGPVTVAVPDVQGMTVAQAKASLKRFGVQVVGKGAKVLRQLPEPEVVLPESQPVYLLTTESGAGGAIPDLKGLPLRDALDLCSLLGAACTVQGEGYVAQQKAEQANGKWKVELTLAPPGEQPAEEPEDDTKDSGDGGKTDSKGAKPDG
ncbi:penicillin-binding transpeptidase domain-containing protein [Cohnella faecalis]|uniref:PASTA domain-containing protein n=1 Tax=Cohnella faecalis TaxID=2315694 RepID=A0A398CP13_9BACL|nr:penicillin-binding transpeptidase domain-containing protein [Cohnella faecalis]RIE04255.1 PASTA domain-containing protein [Cohnella faecalis]